MKRKKKILMQDMVLRRNPEDGTATLSFLGEWTAEHMSERARESCKTIPKDVTHLTVDASKLDALDPSGAWLMVSLLRRLTKSGMEVEWTGLTPSNERVIKLISNIKREDEQKAEHSWLASLFIGAGKYADEIFEGIAELVTFFGQFSITLFNTLKAPQTLRVRSIVYHVNDIGLKATPIIALMAFLIAIVLGYQGANQLKLFGATIFTVNLVSITVLREMGVLITAIMVAGRSSSAFAAQIGVMKMNDEINALQTLGLDPFELLVIPRILGILIALPILTFISDLAGLLGTYVVSKSVLDMSYLQFMTRLHGAVKAHMFYVGLMKAPFFALLIGMVGCMQGMQVKTSATELGERTTMAVVQSIFLIIMADAVFSILFTWFGI